MPICSPRNSVLGLDDLKQVLVQTLNCEDFTWKIFAATDKYPLKITLFFPNQPAKTRQAFQTLLGDENCIRLFELRMESKAGQRPTPEPKSHPISRPEPASQTVQLEVDPITGVTRPDLQTEILSAQRRTVNTIQFNI